MEFESFLCEKTNHKSLATCERTQILVRNRESPLTAGSTRGEPSNSRESRACTASGWKVARMTWGTIRVTKWHQHPPHDLLALECSSFWHFHQALTRHGHQWSSSSWCLNVPNTWSVVTNTRVCCEMSDSFEVLISFHLCRSESTRGGLDMIWDVTL